MENTINQQNSSWSGQLGFLFSAVSSAIGLANIWKFPYMVGQYGGGAFVLLYLLFLVILGYPLLLCEVSIGYKSRASVGKAYYMLSAGNVFWKFWPKIIVFTGFAVGVYYACIAGWFVGYSAIALSGGLTQLESSEQASALFVQFTSNPRLVLLCASSFFLCCIAIVSLGVKNGIETASRLLIPLLFAILLMMGGWVAYMLSHQTLLHPLFTCDFSSITSRALLEALGHAFFTLSLGQGTMVAYGSYLPKQQMSSIASMTAIVAMSDTLVSLLSAFSILGFCSLAGISISAGPGLVFETLPLLFNQLPCGYLFTNLFFGLLLIATVTSEISVIEPVILYLEQTFGLTRGVALRRYTLSALFLLSIVALESTSPLFFQGMTLLSLFDLCCTSVLIPLGGLITALFIPLVLGRQKIIEIAFAGSKFSEKTIAQTFCDRIRILSGRFAAITVSWICMTLMPISIVIVFIQALFALLY